jgi:hypothetical protein
LADDAAMTARAQKGEEDLQQMDLNSVQYRHTRTMRTDYPVLVPNTDTTNQPLSPSSFFRTIVNQV